MLLNILYLLLAALGLGFLVFIHELGHYFAARFVGMKVEAFAIGFGKPLFMWERKGVKWQVCVLPFGGYVRIAGMEKKGKLEPYQIPDGFYGKKPSQRIFVALMGPLTNIIFAFLVFTAIWFMGGREKYFSEFTRMVGWVEPSTELYQKEEIRPGDRLISYKNRPLHSFSDLYYAALLDKETGFLEGEKVDYWEKTATRFVFPFDPSREMQAGFSRIGPASFLIFDRTIEESPVSGNGIEPGDRILWVNGELIFSSAELRYVINQPTTLLTVEREGSTFVVRVPRIKISDLRIAPDEKSELDDWQHAANLKKKVSDLFFIPYNITRDCTIDHCLSYLNESTEECSFQPTPRSSLEVPLCGEDKIIAVDGMPVTSAFELLARLQEQRVHLIVEREGKRPSLSWKEADAHYYDQISFGNLQALINSLGTVDTPHVQSNLVLLSPVIPQSLDNTEASQKRNEMVLKEIEKIEDTKEREMALRLFEQEQNSLKLGVLFHDLKVRYNPSPLFEVASVFERTWRTLVGLLTGYLSPKAVQGPVGIVQVMQQSWEDGAKEALYWIGFISLNLALLNLLPVPVLDGGHICLSLVESVTKKPLKAKTMEWLVIPFVILLVAFLIFVTYQDLVRLIKGFF